MQDYWSGEVHMAKWKVSSQYSHTHLPTIIIAVPQCHQMWHGTCACGPSCKY